jgi:hypothetical protein
MYYWRFSTLKKDEFVTSLFIILYPAHSICAFLITFKHAGMLLPLSHLLNTREKYATKYGRLSSQGTELPKKSFGQHLYDCFPPNSYICIQR